MSKSFEPIACSLPLVESRNQIFDWQEIGKSAVSRERIEGGMSVVFDPGIAEAVEDLARRESACCGFLDIETERSTDGIRLKMTSIDATAMPVIELLMGSPD